MTTRHIDDAAFLGWLTTGRRDFHADYLAMYSSWFGGIVTNPLLMLVPADDHMVHRGDAVFEACNCIAGAFYNLEAHLARLDASAAEINLQSPMSHEQLIALLCETVRAGGAQDCEVRVFLSRGPGSFAVSPRDCPEPQVYACVTRRHPTLMERHPGGIKVKTCVFPLKPAFFATIKSCNYLSNAMMKQEAMEAGAMIAAGFDENDCLAEGATENIGIVTRDRRLLFPQPGNILEGTTMHRVLALSAALVQSGKLAAAERAPISRKAFFDAAEILVCSTSSNVTAATSVDGRPVGGGTPGPIFELLSELLQDDIWHNDALRIPVWK